MDAGQLNGCQGHHSGLSTQPAGTNGSTAVGTAAAERGPRPGTRRGEAASGHRFRGDVEGLRAVAIGAVLAYHAEVAVVSGGYVGVDVFFVISGFLITGLLLRELDTNGTISLTRFYARRARRLLPSAMVVLTAVTLLTWLLMSPVERRSVFREVIAAALYVVNWQQAGQAVDYSALGAEASPVQHFWSLAVEEQFYLLWPLAILAVVGLRRRLRLPGSARAQLAVLLAGAGGLSFGYSVYLTQLQGEAAYFSTATRAWELAAGGLLALVPASWWRWPRRMPDVLALTGLALILAAVVGFTDETAFPGPGALVPVAGTAAVIAAGAASSDTAGARLLRLAPMRYLGRISYVWYLWHWPAVVFATAVFSGLPGPLLVAVVALSWIPAALTHRLVEEPVRRLPGLAPVRRAVPLGVVCTALPVTLSVLAWTLVPSVPLATPDEAKGAKALREEPQPQQKARALRPLPEQATADRGKVHQDGCLVPQKDTHSGDCTYGHRSADTTVVLFGDSHAMQYAPALREIAEQRDWRLVVLTKSGCSPAEVTVYNAQYKREYTECDIWREQALERIRRERPALVVTGNRPDLPVARSGEKLDGQRSATEMKRGYVRTLRKLKRTAEDVVTLADNPQPPEDMPSCVSEFLDRLTECAFPKSIGLRHERVNKEAADEVAEVRLIDPTPMLCPNDTCPAVIGNVLVFRNGAHITATYMHTLRDWLDRQLPAKV